MAKGNKWEEHGKWWLKMIRNKNYPPEVRTFWPGLVKVLKEIDFKNKKVLDAGCGEGRFGEFMKNRGANIVGVDVSPALLSLAKTKIKVKKADIRELPFRNNTFDFILCSMVLMTIRDYEIAIKEFRRVLKEGGGLLIAIVHPCFEYWSRKQKWPFKNSKEYKEIKKRFWHFKFSNGTSAVAEYWHRPLEQYFHAFRSNGFMIENIWEPNLLKHQNGFAFQEYLIVKLKRSTH